MQLPRKVAYVIGFVFVSLNILVAFLTGRLRDLLGFFAVLAVLVVPPYLYKRLPNGPGALRGLEHGSKWQFQEHLKRQSKLVQATYLWLNRLRVACLGTMLGGFLAFCGMSTFSIASGLLGWFIFSIAWPLWWIFNGAGTFVVRGGNFPRELLVGKREFVVGPKATFASISRIAIGVLLLSMPLNFLYLIYLIATGQLGEMMLQSLRRRW